MMSRVLSVLSAPASASGRLGSRSILLLIVLALAQIVVGGFGFVDGRTLQALFADPSGRSVAPSSQYLLDSPLPIAIGHFGGVRSLAGVAALSAFYAALPALTLAALWLTRKLTILQALSVASVFCVLQTWKVLTQYLGKPDGLVILLVSLAVLSGRRFLTLLSTAVLVTAHVQMGLATGLMLICLDWPERQRRLAAAAGCAAGFAAARLLQSALGVSRHQGRFDYALTFWETGGSGMSPWLVVAIVGALGGAWFFVCQKWKGATGSDRLRLCGSLLFAAALSIIAFDNSRDMYLLCLPAVLWSVREKIWSGRVHPLSLGVVALTLALIPLPDIVAGGIRRHDIEFLPAPSPTGRGLGTAP